MSCDLSKLNESAGTGEPFKLHKKTVILTNQYAVVFFTNSHKQVNSLPSNIVSAGTQDSFKNLL